MFVVLFCRTVGWILAHLPERFLALFCQAAGAVIYALPLGRVRSTRSNLHHAFPERDRDWLDRVGRASFQRLVETAFLVLASPHFGQRWFEKHLLLDDRTRRAVREALAAKQGFVTLLPHLTLSEMLSAIPAVEPAAAGAATIYRPVEPPALDAWLKKVRSRWGLDLLARREALHGAGVHLREGKPVVLLFDQNTGRRGKHIFFFDRLASATHFPGLLAQRFRVPAYLLFPHRTAFWKCRMEYRLLSDCATAEDVTLAANSTLEEYLRESADQCADWLWSHNRWQTQEQARVRFRLNEPDSYLARALAQSGRGAYPKRTRIWIRMPNWLGDVVMTVPLIRALLRGRPDAEFTLLAPPHFVQLLKSWDVADRVRALPVSRGNPLRALHALRILRSWNREYPDTWVTFTNSVRGDLEGWCIRIPQRFGIVRPGRWRPLLTDAWRVPTQLDESSLHQTAFWEQYLRRFGLREPLDFEPLGCPESNADAVALICGTENTPEKRWPVAHWRSLVDHLLTTQPGPIVLFGTARDWEITASVAEGFPPERVHNRAGRTTLPEFAAALGRCRLMVCNDTGAMHLANALGVPLVAIFGPTNPIRTGPVFNAPFRIVQPPGCPPHGGEPIGQVQPAQVLEAINEVTKRSDC